ncbi:MAG: rRNA maturation RNase YbeY [Pedobacter sp.]|nr:rRNA maturation RNase YbeY [Pedobacter sp.]
MQSASTTVIDLQLESTATGLPSEQDFQRWADAALRAAEHEGAAEITVRIVDEAEGRELNHEYRERDYATNVLSFPSELPDFLKDEMDVLPLGDLVICAPVVAREATEQGKPLQDHWAHLTVHGVLHLLGFDHIEDEEAEDMEARETAILAGMGIANPYEEN